MSTQPQLAFKSRKTGKIFKIVSIDGQAGTITMRGDLSEFTEPYDKARFERMGYELIQIEPEKE